jgi:hypothetical protein
VSPLLARERAPERHPSDRPTLAERPPLTKSPVVAETGPTTLAPRRAPERLLIRMVPVMIALAVAAAVAYYHYQ